MNRWKSIAWIIGPPLAIVLVALLLIRPSLGSPADESPTPTAIAAALPTGFPSTSFEPVTVASVQINAVPFEEGASVNDFVLAGDRVIAGGAVGDTAAIWYSDTRGQTWSRAAIETPNPPDGRAQPQIEALAVHEGRLAALGHWYLGRTGNPITHGVWISDDAGETWTQVPVDLPSQVMLSRIAGGDFGFVGIAVGAGVTVYRSDDGTDWDELEDDTSFRGAQILDVIVHDDWLVMVGLGEETGGEGAKPYLWRFTNAGGWQPQTLGGLGSAIIGEITTDATGLHAAGMTFRSPDPRRFDESTASIWQSADGENWSQRALSQTVGTQAGNLASGPLGLLITGNSTDAYEGRRDRKRPQFIWFIPNGEGNQTVQEYHVPWFGIASIGLPDRFLVFGRCPTDPDGCAGSMLVTIMGSDEPYAGP